MNMVVRTALAIFSIIFIGIACSKSDNGSANNTLDCSTIANKAFAADINPVIQATCNVAGCHATGSTNGPGPLTNYSQVFNARSNIRVNIASGNMPRGTALTTAQKNSILCWIDGGAPNN